MGLDLINNIFNNIKENGFVQNFIKELSNYLEKNLTRRVENIGSNLLADNLEIGDQKIIAKYKDKMLMERANILQNYALKTKNNGEMYYIYNIDTNEKDTYNLCICKTNESNEVITKPKEELPEGATIGSVLRKGDGDFVLDNEGTKYVETEINKMINEKIEEQNEYLSSKRVEGHIYEADEKYSGRIWLYDLNNKVGGSLESIEEIEFPKNLYETAKKGDKFVYQNGEYQKYE